MKECAWNDTNLSHYNDSSGRICFSFLLYLFFFFLYYPTLCSDDRAVMESRQKFLLGASVSKLDAGSLGLMMIHWRSSAMNSSMWVSERVISWVRGTKQFGDIIIISSCDFLLLVLQCQYPVGFLAGDPIPCYEVSINCDVHGTRAFPEQFSVMRRGYRCLGFARRGRWAVL